MQILSQIFTPYTLNESCLRHGASSKTLAFSRSPLRLKKKKKIWSDGDMRGKFCRWAGKGKRTVVSAVEKGNLGAAVRRKRKVVEHICLVKAKENLSEEQENDMLDYLYTTQYQMRGIVAISLGRISDQNPEQYTHAIFMRFQTKEDLAKFYGNPFYTKVLKEHVMPYCHGCINLDYESEVEDDILPIFRKGEEFHCGVELMLLVAFVRNSLNGPAEDAMTSLANLTMEFPSLIVQVTKGANMNMSSAEYTHGIVVRFRSAEALNIFMSSSGYNTDLCEEILNGVYLETKKQLEEFDSTLLCPSLSLLDAWPDLVALRADFIPPVYNGVIVHNFVALMALATSL